jgi:hypothetical protein
VRSTTGRLSDVIARRRNDWSRIDLLLRRLQPGERVTLTCPPGYRVKMFRSVILTKARRMEFGDWKVSTITEHGVVHCFLVPVEK